MKVPRHKLILGACAALLTACSSPGYNDNPSQQITDARIGCLAANDFFAVYFMTRVQQTSAGDDTGVANDPFRPYCSEIPGPGRIFFTADLVGSSLKTVPIAIRVTEQNGESDGNLEDERIITEIAARAFSKGTIESQFEVDKNGVYAIYLIRQVPGAQGAADTLKIPVTVGGFEGDNLISDSLAVVGLVVLGLFALRRARTSKARQDQ